ncbi:MULTISPECIES: ImmA/IrrE family metallo-endopeptidase [unclassified Corynebacterium]|uniref:ImmA/IrrE family metallo-endopeptidase n=1 Tax=unclassified Corynebacterium TaxID=2624378 RepID=UPI0029CA8AAC|nr:MULTISPECIES: ImmA/IrrE family metallo-endopeptidase [unclassified Corynebacterium]WPF66392.1 ImmA/IrrE family metallo-endopeptidase [Corynebacterium sp. 22KM0430]WPF68882.1 ImmA/IrrE family metallo-endopeptidase [Corynebacterium sp. 21KM1197]
MPAFAERLAPEQVAAIRREATDAATNILEKYWDTDTFPVDPFEIATRYGAEVHRGDMPEDVEGLFRPKGDQYKLPQIWVDTDYSFVRQRFTCAHELGHMVEDGETSQIDRRRDDNSAKGSDPHEVYANAFAAELLMPGYAVRQLWQLGADLFSLASFFGVSKPSMEYRLKNLRLI